ncbi:MAG: hypothetical protein JXB50_15005 [Spirochaetes bacterium]|nr:hypothetical protein [Spirochaetota bacterium]
MRQIQPYLTFELFKHFKDPDKISAGEPFCVNSFRALVELTSKLSYKNYLLFYRGQSFDQKNKENGRGY